VRSSPGVVACEPPSDANCRPAPQAPSASAAQEPPAGAESRSDSASSGGSAGGAADAASRAYAWAASALQPLLSAPMEQLERLQALLADQQRAVTSGALWASARQRLDDADAAWGVSSKARIASQRVRDALLKLDAQLGIGATVRAKGPGLWRAFNDARETPVGQALWFIATAWLFLSGAFWTLLSWGFLVLLVGTLVAPTLLRSVLDDALASAAEQAAAAGGAPPGGPRGGAGSGAGGAAGRGAGGAYARGAQAGARRDFSGVGPVVDVDADVKDV
jgi:hypothetical protein